MPGKYGIPDPVPHGFWGQIIYPVRPINLAEETAGLFVVREERVRRLI
jgi:hypothetical protein